MFKKAWQSFSETAGRVLGFILFIVMSVVGIIFFLDKSNAFKQKKKNLGLYVKNPKSKEDKEKADELEDALNSLNDNSN